MNVAIDRVESLDQVDEDGCTVAVMISFRTLSVVEVHP
jgi:hypothetical protein